MEEMEVNHVDDIHEKLTEMVGDRVEVEERRGRKSRQSYQYIDVLTGQVELFDPETGEHIFTPLGNQLEEH